MSEGDEKLLMIRGTSLFIIMPVLQGFVNWFNRHYTVEPLIKKATLA